MPTWKRTLYVLFFAQLMTALGFSSSFPFLSLYVKSLPSQTGVSKELLIGLAFSSQAFTMMLISPIWGMMADRHGRKMMVLRATFGGAILLGLMGFARSGEELVLLRTLQGFVTGVTPAITALVAAVAPREKSGYSMGLIQVAMWSGVSLGPFVGGIIADTMGYQATYLVTAVMLAGTWLLVWWVVEENFVPPTRESRQQKGSLTHQWREILTLPGVVATYTLLGFVWMIRTMLTPYTPLFIALLLHNEKNIATVTGIIAGGAALSTTVCSLFLGRMGDQVGHRKILLAGTVGAVAFSLPQSAVVNVWQLGILQVLVGAAVGAMMPALNALLASYTPAGTEGAVYGLDTSISSATRTIAPLLGAAAVAAFGLRGVFLIGGFTFMISLVIALRHMPQTEQEKLQGQKLAAKAHATAGD